MDNSSKFNTVEWFFGYGGNHLGLKRVLPNLRLLAVCEIEEFAIENILAKMENGLLEAAPIWSDCKTFPREPFKNRVDLFIASYPCQPFSSAGKRQGADDPRHLWPYVRGFVRDVRPRLCFFENVDGHVSMGLSTVISDLEQDGYRTAWGVFSAAEVGAPHQRKRVFILAVADQHSERLEGFRRFIQESVSQGREGTNGHAWPSRPGEPQHGWEPPRVVANTQSRLSGFKTERQGREDIRGGSPKELGDTTSLRLCESRENSRTVDENSNGEECGVHESEGAGALPRHGSKSETVAYSPSEGADQRHQFCEKDGGSVGELSRVDQSASEVMVNAGCIRSTECQQQTAGVEQSDKREAESSLGLHVDEYPRELGQALTLNPYGHNVSIYENLSDKECARQVLFKVWREVTTKKIQWTDRGLQCFLAEKILLSGVQLGAFTQRICFFVWCIQTGNEAKGFGLRGMWIYETSGSPSQGQEPIEQFKRELGYALCQLSYEIALERRKDAVEGESILQGVRESSERAWILSEALPEMEEIWRSTLDQTVWEKGCYIEATSNGNRTDELRLLGNGVVPATAERAFRTLVREILEGNQ